MKVKNFTGDVYDSKIENAILEWINSNPVTVISITTVQTASNIKYSIWYSEKEGN